MATHFICIVIALVVMFTSIDISHFNENKVELFDIYHDVVVDYETRFVADELDR